MIHRPVRWTSKRDIDVTRVSPRVVQSDVWSTGFAREVRRATRTMNQLMFRYWLESTIFQKITTTLGWLATCCTKEDLLVEKRRERQPRGSRLCSSDASRVYLHHITKWQKQFKWLMSFLGFDWFLFGCTWGLVEKVKARWQITKCSSKSIELRRRKARPTLLSKWMPLLRTRVTHITYHACCYSYDDDAVYTLVLFYCCK